jgi:hypothetical protein
MGGHPQQVCSRVGGRGRHWALRCRGVAVGTRGQLRAVPDLRQRAVALRTAPGGHRSRLPCHVRRSYAGSKDAAVTSKRPQRTAVNAPSHIRRTRMSSQHRSGTSSARDEGAGLVSRLSSHASGQRSGNRFCIYVCDRLVLKTLTAQEIEEVAAGRLSLDQRTRDLIRTKLAFRFVSVPDNGRRSTSRRPSRRARWMHARTCRTRSRTERPDARPSSSGPPPTRCLANRFLATPPAPAGYWAGDVAGERGDRALAVRCSVPP